MACLNVDAGVEPEAERSRSDAVPDPRGVAVGQEAVDGGTMAQVRMARPGRARTRVM